VRVRAGPVNTRTGAAALTRLGLRHRVISAHAPLRLLRARALTRGFHPGPQACLGDIYDVTKGADFYGVDGPYNKFAGRCASRRFCAAAR
jgi:hypothetical protein